MICWHYNWLPTFQEVESKAVSYVTLTRRMSVRRHASCHCDFVTLSVPGSYFSEWRVNTVRVWHLRGGSGGRRNHANGDGRQRLLWKRSGIDQRHEKDGCQEQREKGFAEETLKSTDPRRQVGYSTICHLEGCRVARHVVARDGIGQSCLEKRRVCKWSLLDMRRNVKCLHVTLQKSSPYPGFNPLSRPKRCHSNLANALMNEWMNSPA